MVVSGRFAQKKVPPIASCRKLGASSSQPMSIHAMKEDYEIEEKKQAAADVLFQYSKFVMACIGNQVRPCDLRLHLMKEVSGLPTSLKKASPQTVASPDAMGESSSSGTTRLDKTDGAQLGKTYEAL